jgi:DNA (cytosine-5)-methyltransferase 1
LEDSLAKTCPWREWGRELGLKGSSLDSFMSFIDYLSRVAPEFFSSKTCQAFSLPTEDETSSSLFERWPNSGMVWAGVCLTAKTSECPNHAKESSLWDLMEKAEVPLKYFLSPNAAKGILRRADRMERNLFPPLREALEILAKGQS